MVNFCVVLNLFYFVVAIFDLMHDLESVFHLFNCEQHVEFFSEIRVIPGKRLHNYHSYFQKEFQMLVLVSILYEWLSHRALGHT